MPFHSQMERAFLFGSEISSFIEKETKTECPPKEADTLLSLTVIQESARFCPKFVLIAVGQAVTEYAVFSDCEIFNRKRSIDRQRIGKLIAALIVAVVIVEVAEKYDLVTVLNRNQTLGNGIGFAVRIDALGTENRNIVGNIVAFKNDHQVDLFTG